MAEKLESRILGALFVVCCGVLGTLGSWQIGRLTKIEEQLTKIQVDLVAIQSSILDEEKVKRIVETELLRRGIK